MAIEEIRARLLRATAVLQRAGIDYAVMGGNAVAEWVGRVDKAAVRFTRDVDVLLRRDDMPRAIEAMKPAGFIHCKTFDVDMFLDGPDGTPRNAVHILFAGEKVRSNDLVPLPEVTQSEAGDGFSVLSLQPLVTTKLVAFRDKDRVHLRDMLDVGLIDATWIARFPDELGERLRFLIENPE